MEVPTGYANVAHVMVSEGDPDEMVNTWGVRLTDDTTLLDDLASMMDAWRDAVEDEVSSIIHRTRAVLYQSPADGADIVELPFADGTFGANAGNVAPNNTSYTIRKTAGIGGRRHRGRVLLPGVLTGLLTDTGEVNSATQVALNSGLLVWLGSFPHGGIAEPVILHSDAAFGPPDGIAQMTVSPKLATTRHRYRN